MELDFDYSGLNHLGWLRSVRDRLGKDLLADLLDNPALREHLSEGTLFEVEFLHRLRMLPREYLTHFYYPHRQMYATATADGTRAEYLVKLQEKFHTSACTGTGESLCAWRATRAERERSYMAEARRGHPRSSRRRRWVMLAVMDMRRLPSR